MKKFSFVITLLAFTVAAAAQHVPDVAAKAKVNAPKSTITVKVDGMSCSTTAGTDTFSVLAWSWGASNPVTVGGSGGGAGAGKASVSSLNIMKKFDQCSPKLFEGVVLGKHFNTLTLTQEDSDNNVQLIVSLDKVFVESWQLSGSTSDALPAESVSFAFEKVCVSEPSSSTKVCYNLATSAAQ